MLVFTATHIEIIIVCGKRRFAVGFGRRVLLACRDWVVLGVRAGSLSCRPCFFLGLCEGVWGGRAFSGELALSCVM